MKILVIGGIAGGMSAASRAKRIDENAEVIVFERGDVVAFSNCGLPYHLSEEIKTKENLILMPKEGLINNYDLDVRTGHNVIDINREEKYVTVSADGSTYEESYDKLILSPGVRPRMLDIPGLSEVPNSNLTTVADAAKIHDTMAEEGHKSAIVIGGGYIGIEAAENLKLAGYDVSVIVRSEQVLKTLDYDLVQIIHKELYDKGVDLRLNTNIEKFEGGYAYTTAGDKIAADYIVMAVGMEPNSDLAKKVGLEVNNEGYIKVDNNQLTNDKDIYAIGDATEVFNMLSGDYQTLALAGPAQKQARRASDHIFGIAKAHPGFLGSAAVRVFDYNVAKTGLSERELAKMGKTNYDYVLVIPKEKVGLMPGAEDNFFKLIYETPSGKLLGAQGVSKGEAVKRVDQIAAMLPFGATLDDAVNFEQCYAPPFALARDAVNFAGMVGLNVLTGAVEQVHLNQVRDLVNDGAYILDVRPAAAFEKAHIKGAVNIPLGQLRDRRDEIPRDRPVYIHCRSSQSSYYGLRALKGYGFDNIISMQGSILGLSFHEYYRDITEDRESILTAYNFN